MWLCVLRVRLWVSRSSLCTRSIPWGAWGSRLRRRSSGKRSPWWPCSRERGRRDSAGPHEVDIRAVKQKNDVTKNLRTLKPREVNIRAANRKQWHNKPFYKVFDEPTLSLFLFHLENSPIRQKYHFCLQAFLQTQFHSVWVSCLISTSKTMKSKSNSNTN